MVDIRATDWELDATSSIHPFFASLAALSIWRRGLIRWLDGRSISLLVVASLARLSASSFPGSPTWAGIHRRCSLEGLLRRMTWIWWVSGVLAMEVVLGFARACRADFESQKMVAWGSLRVVTSWMASWRAISSPMKDGVWLSMRFWMVKRSEVMAIADWSSRVEASV